MSKSIDYSLLKKLSEDEIRKQLIKLKGIGIWTCDMILIFFLMRPNILPQNDLIIEKVKKKLCLIENKEINFAQIYSPNLSIYHFICGKCLKGFCKKMSYLLFLYYSFLAN